MTASNTASSCDTSCRCAPVTTSDNGTPRPSTNRRRLLPLFPPIRRIGSHALLCQWCLHHGAINALPSPSDALEFVVLRQPQLPQGFKDTGLFPFKKSCMNDAGATVPLSRQRLPLAARS